MNVSFRRKLLFTIALAAALYLAGTIWIGWRDIVDALATFRWQILPICLALSCLNYAIRFCKWHGYLGILQINIPRRVSFQIFLSGMALSATPGKFGEVFKSYLLKGINGTPISKSAPIVFAERLTDFLAFLLLALLGVTLIPNGAQVFLISIALAAGIIILISWKSAMDFLIGQMERLPVVGSKVGHIHTAYGSAYRLIAPKPLLWATVISIFSWWSECLAFWLVLWGFNSPISIVSATFIYAFGTIMGALLMTPGGVGPTEGALGGLLVLIEHVATGAAASATLVIRLCTLWFAVVVGLVALIFSQKAFEASHLEGIDLADNAIVEKREE